METEREERVDDEKSEGMGDPARGCGINYGDAGL
jgi:hypothetical protein